MLGDSVTAIGFMIAFYYGFTGLACVIYYRKAIFRSGRNFFFAGLLPLVGFAMLAFVFVRAYIDYGTKGYAETSTTPSRASDRDPDPHRHRRPAARASC